MIKSVPLRIVFAGTPPFGLPCLDALKASEHQLIAVYTQPDRPAGRGRQLQPSAVKGWALMHDIAVYQPAHFKEEATITAFAALKPDIMVVIAYGLILPSNVLNIPRLGCINVHASLLPRWRGASPIQHAILHGDKKTGITVMQMDKGMDTGEMLARIECPIAQNDTTQTLHDKLAHLAPPPLLNTVLALSKGSATREKQYEDLATYAPKISKEQARIHWHQPAQLISQQIRAFTPWPIAYTQFEKEIIRIHQASVLEYPSAADHTPGTILSCNKKGLIVSTSEDALLIEKIQLAGGKVIAIADYLNGAQHVFYENAIFS